MNSGYIVAMICWSTTVFATAVAMLFAAKTVRGYDFHNSEFNQLLANDLDDLYSNNLQHRARRSHSGEDENKCGHFRHKPKLCCAEAAFEAMHEAERDVRRMCFREVTGNDRPERPPHSDPFRCDAMEKHRNEINCVFQCVAQKRGVVDDSGQVVEDEFIKYSKEALAEAPYMDSMVDKIAQDCIKEANTDATPEGGCNPTAIKLAHCFFRNVQLSCPDDEINDKQSCETLQERLKSGDNFPPSSPPQRR